MAWRYRWARWWHFSCRSFNYGRREESNFRYFGPSRARALGGSHCCWLRPDASTLKILMGISWEYFFESASRIQAICRSVLLLKFKWNLRVSLAFSGSIWALPRRACCPSSTSTSTSTSTTSATARKYNGRHFHVVLGTAHRPVEVCAERQHRASQGDRDYGKDQRVFRRRRARFVAIKPFAHFLPPFVLIDGAKCSRPLFQRGAEPMMALT